VAEVGGHGTGMKEQERKGGGGAGGGGKMQAEKGSEESSMRQVGWDQCGRWQAGMCRGGEVCHAGRQ